MGRYPEEKRQAFLSDPSDKRHGTFRGYQLKCRCDRCLEAGRAYASASAERARERKLAKYREEREREKRQIAKARANAKPRATKDICTVPEFLRPLMGKPNLSNAEGRCCWCGAYGATNHHHVVKRSAGTWTKNGVTVSKPTILLCGDGNMSGCHEKAHQGLLHFDWKTPDRKAAKFDVEPAPYGSGCWVGQEFDEPLSQFEAMQVEKGWRKL